MVGQQPLKLFIFVRIEAPEHFRTRILNYPFYTARSSFYTNSNINKEEFEKNPEYYGYCSAKLAERVLVHPNGIIRIYSLMIVLVIE